VTAAVLHGAMDLRWEARPLEALPANAVRVRFGAGGICGSDLAYYRYGRSGDFVLTSPLVLGHEVAGTIAEVGASVRGRRVGERVAIHPARTCGRCPRCAEGRANLCERVFFMGSASKTPHMQGGFVEFIDVEPDRCFPVPDRTDLRDAALAEPLAVALHAVARAGSVAGERAVVFGAGPIGLLLMMVAKHGGAAHVTVVDVAAAPLAAAHRLGADAVVDASGNGGALDGLADVDVAFEASGSEAGVRNALAVLRRGGTLVQVGNLSRGDVTIPFNQVMAKELRVAGSFRFGDEFGEAVALIGSGAIAAGAIVSGQLPLAEAAEAFALAADRSRSVKVMLTGQA
jgi:L-idonate 5-dehydrogenase